jgi:hypothetical protein
MRLIHADAALGVSATDTSDMLTPAHLQLHKYRSGIGLSNLFELLR